MEQLIKDAFISYLNEIYPQWKEEIPNICISDFDKGPQDKDCFNWVKTNNLFKHFRAGYLSGKDSSK